MDISQFDYSLPPEAIAQRPADRRDRSRLLRVVRGEGRLEHRRFDDLPGLLRPGDLLVLNDTRVVPARVDLCRTTGGRVEGLFVREFAAGWWEMMIRGRGRIREGERLDVVGAEGQGLWLERREGGGVWIVRPEPAAEPVALLERVGRTPLPPYIRREADDERAAADSDRYQTVYADRPGAVAAPTAGLHFTPELLSELERRGVQTARLTLHVGLGTFQPVKVERIEDHRMHAERYHLPAATAEAVRRARADGRRVVAVGTTSVRVLETVARQGDGEIRESRGESDLFITPGFEFRAVDALITNFHLPRSTLLMLVCAFAGRDLVLEAYREAIDGGYRFYSYGDACLIE